MNIPGEQQNELFWS